MELTDSMGAVLFAVGRMDICHLEMSVFYTLHPRPEAPHQQHRDGVQAREAEDDHILRGVWLHLVR